jgi:hypothetical protein
VQTVPTIYYPFQASGCSRYKALRIHTIEDCNTRIFGGRDMAATSRNTPTVTPVAHSQAKHAPIGAGGETADSLRTCALALFVWRCVLRFVNLRSLVEIYPAINSVSHTGVQSQY